jgi:hypothetical protein
MKQTAVEWFAKELNNWRIKEFGEDAIIGIPTEVFEQAKAMEKERKQKVNLLLDTLLENNMCSVVGDELIQTFKSE